jgi:putative glutamine amidotransferase
MTPGSLPRPLIGVTTSEVRPSPNSRPLREGDPPQREMALGLPYLRAIERAGGLPVVLPPLQSGAIPALLDRLSGICLSGGPDLDPAGYGATAHAELGVVEPDLDRFELGVAREADRRGMPVLGICRGQQALNVARGGTLHQHLADVVDGTIDHRQGEPGTVPTHAVEVLAGSRLAGILGGGAAVQVNSFHHQAVDRLGTGLRAVAWAPDGVVEGIESTGTALYLGVQWHAEGLVDDPAHLRLFERLVLDAAAWTESPARAEAA